MIACITVSYFASAIERRIDNTLSEQPLVIGGKPWEPRPVYAYSHEVAQLGVAPGMSLRLAHVLSPESNFLPSAPAQYLNASGEVVDILSDFSPLIEPEELWQPMLTSWQQETIGGRTLPARYYLDMEGLPLPEAVPLAREIGRTIQRESKLTPAVGLAQNKFVAQVAASLSTAGRLLPVQPQKERSFLAPYSIDFLPLDKENARRMRLLGIRTLGQLAELPSGSMVTQFGSTIKPYYLMARGRAVNPVRPLNMEKAVRAAHHFEEPVDNLIVLEAVLAQLAAALVEQLAASGMEGRVLRLAWETERQPARDPEEQPGYSHVMRRPTSNLSHMVSTFHQLLGQNYDLGAGSDTQEYDGIVSLGVAISDLSPAAASQLNLFTTDTARKEAPQTVNNVVAKHGARLFFTPELTDRYHPLPTQRFQLREYGTV